MNKPWEKFYRLSAKQRAKQTHLLVENARKIWELEKENEILKKQLKVEKDWCDRYRYLYHKEKGWEE